MMPSAQELIVILLIIIVIFGANKIPEIMKGLGKGIKEFKKAKDDVNDSEKDKPSDPKEKS